MTQAHIMADTESLGEAGVAGSRRSRRTGRAAPRARPDHHRSARHRFHQGGVARAGAGDAGPRAARDRRFRQARRAMTDTCINYQTIQAPTRGEHVAFGDTGVVIYSNSVCGARSNFEGGPSALAAGLTGRTPRYGFHLDAAAPRDGARSRRLDARDAQRMGRARRRDRPHRGQLLGGAGHRGHRGRAGIGCAEAFRRGDGELRLGRAVSPRGPDARSRRGCRDVAAARCAEPSRRRAPT